MIAPGALASDGLTSDDLPVRHVYRRLGLLVWDWTTWCGIVTSRDQVIRAEVFSGDPVTCPGCLEALRVIAWPKEGR